MPVMRPRANWLPLVIAAMVACSGGPTFTSRQLPYPATSPAAAEPLLAAGYRLFDGGTRGFRLGLAPEWSGSAEDGQWITFTDPSARGSFLIHYESAVTKNLDAAVAVAMIQLTGGTGGARVSSQDTTVAGLPARQIIASFATGGAVARIEAYVLVEGERFWSLALAAPQEVFDSDRVDLERMVLSFALKDARPAPEARASVGRPAPTFDLKGPACSRVSLDAVRGPVVFFAGWCPSCREEMPLLQSRADRSGGRFTVVGIATHDDPGTVPGFLKEVGVRFPVGYDSNGETTARYQVPSVPATFFLDAKHILRQTVVGPLTKDSLEAGLRAAGVA